MELKKDNEFIQKEKQVLQDDLTNFKKENQKLLG